MNDASVAIMNLILVNQHILGKKLDEIKITLTRLETAMKEEMLQREIDSGVEEETLSIVVVELGKLKGFFDTFNEESGTLESSDGEEIKPCNCPACCAAMEADKEGKKERVMYNFLVATSVGNETVQAPSETMLSWRMGSKGYGPGSYIILNKVPVK